MSRGPRATTWNDKGNLDERLASVASHEKPGGVGNNRRDVQVCEHF